MMPKETIGGPKQENDSMKQQIAALANEVKSMKGIKLLIAARKRLKGKQREAFSFSVTGECDNYIQCKYGG